MPENHLYITFYSYGEFLSKCQQPKQFNTFESSQFLAFDVFAGKSERGQMTVSEEVCQVENKEIK